MEVASLEASTHRSWQASSRSPSWHPSAMGNKCMLHIMNGSVVYQINSIMPGCGNFLVQQLNPSNAAHHRLG